MWLITWYERDSGYLICYGSLLGGISEEDKQQEPTYREHSFNIRESANHTGESHGKRDKKIHGNFFLRLKILNLRIHNELSIVPNLHFPLFKCC